MAEARDRPPRGSVPGTAGPVPAYGRSEAPLRRARTMRAGLNPIHAALLLPLAVLAASPARARPDPGPHHARAASDMDRTLARMAEAALRDGRARQAPTPRVLVTPPETRERVAAPPFTGWGYGGTIPGAGPGF